MSELGRKPLRGVIAGAGKRLDNVGQRLRMLFTSLLASPDFQESKARLEFGTFGIEAFLEPRAILE